MLVSGLESQPGHLRLVAAAFLPLVGKRRQEEAFAAAHLTEVVVRPYQTTEVGIAGATDKQVDRLATADTLEEVALAAFPVELRILEAGPFAVEAYIPEEVLALAEQAFAYLVQVDIEEAAAFLVNSPSEEVVA